MLFQIILIIIPWIVGESMINVTTIFCIAFWTLFIRSVFNFR